MYALTFWVCIGPMPRIRSVHHYYKVHLCLQPVEILLSPLSSPLAHRTGKQNLRWITYTSMGLWRDIFICETAQRYLLSYGYPTIITHPSQGATKQAALTFLQENFKLLWLSENLLLVGKRRIHESWHEHTPMHACGAVILHSDVH